MYSSINNVLSSCDDMNM